MRSGAQPLHAILLGFLDEQLRTIETQTRTPDELVICDDGSSDRTRAIIDRFAAHSRFAVRVYANIGKLGPAKNFEKAIRLCNGAFIVLCDQDDLWHSEKISRFLNAFEKNPSAIYAFSDAEMIDESGALLDRRLWDDAGVRKDLRHISGAAQLKILLKHNFVPGAAMALRGDFKSILLPVPSSWMHDYWFALIGSALSYGIPIEEPVLQYRRHRMQVCGWGRDSVIQAVRVSLKSEIQQSWDRLRAFQDLTIRLAFASARIQCPEKCLNLIQEKETHLLKRANIRSGKGIARFTKLISEASTGRYGLYSESWRSIIRDI